LTLLLSDAGYNRFVSLSYDAEMTILPARSMLARSLLS